jgi:hypothetical protein
VAKPEAPPVETNLYEEAMKTLRSWKSMLPSIFSKDMTEKMDPPKNVPAVFFEGWRWVFHHFASLKETDLIAQRWWMDTMWNMNMRNDVLSHWVTTGMDEEEKRLAKLFHTTELYKGDVSGYATVDGEKVTFYCFIEGDKAPERCTGQMETHVRNMMGAPVDRMVDTAAIFGFLIGDKSSGNLVFKSVEKPTDIKDKRAILGAQCANNSKLDNHISRTQLIQKQLRSFLKEDHPLVRLLLDDNPATAPGPEEKAKRKAKKEVLHIQDLSQKQICPYMEVLLRFADHFHVGGKRWMLTHIEAMMAGYKLL